MSQLFSGKDNINNLSRTRSIASLPCKIVWEIWCYHDRPSPTLATIFGPVSKLRSQASLHNMPFPTAQKSPFSTFSVLSPLACFAANSNVSTYWKNAKRTVHLVWFNLHLYLKRNHFIIKGCAVVLIVGAYMITNVSHSIKPGDVETESAALPQLSKY